MVPVSLPWCLCMYYNGTWTLWEYLAISKNIPRFCRFLVLAYGWTALKYCGGSCLLNEYPKVPQSQYLRFLHPKPILWFRNQKAQSIFQDLLGKLAKEHQEGYLRLLLRSSTGSHFCRRRLWPALLQMPWESGLYTEPVVKAPCKQAQAIFRVSGFFLMHLDLQSAQSNGPISKKRRV